MLFIYINSSLMTKTWKIFVIDLYDNKLFWFYLNYLWMQARDPCLPELTMMPYSSSKKLMLVWSVFSPPSVMRTNKLPPLSKYFFITLNSLSVNLSCGAATTNTLTPFSSAPLISSLFLYSSTTILHL